MEKAIAIEVNKLEEGGKLGEVETLLSNYLSNNPLDIEAMLLRAQVYYKMQQWGNALNDLNHLLMLEPENTAAQNYKTMVLNIISFWNKDNYNP
ncbi:MAG TPA: hypothetical protein PKV50_05110 [Prolixibacteraceae bacterium]|jgi:regulator of sirC expression with transglutaminase-like and TPR domain|nr:hypothetical protein [Prolixibacteraceae bacterium]